MSPVFIAGGAAPGATHMAAPRRADRVSPRGALRTRSGTRWPPRPTCFLTGS